MVEEYQITNALISDLIPDDTNPNIMTQEEENALERVIKKYGFLAPIIIDKNNNKC